MHPQHFGPQLFVSKGVIAEDGLPPSIPLVIVLVVVSIVPFAVVVRATGGWLAVRAGGNSATANVNASAKTINAAPISRMGRSLLIAASASRLTRSPSTQATRQRSAQATGHVRKRHPFVLKAFGFILNPPGPMARRRRTRDDGRFRAPACGAPCAL
jgi:hypothetical protein